MFKRKCPGCGKKIDKKFSYCPYCGVGIKNIREKEDFGMLGKDDIIERQPEQEMKMPFGLDKVMNSLMKQIEKEMGQMQNTGQNGVPRGFKIQISTGKPQIRQMPMIGGPIKNSKANEIKTIREVPIVSEEEMLRREKLKKISAESKVRRLPDRIVYEISVPGVKNKEDVLITQLEEGIEIKAYSKDKCYVKIIPLKIELIGWYLKQDILVVELKD